jgi:hypothetical protein
MAMRKRTRKQTMVNKSIHRTQKPVQDMYFYGELSYMSI